MKVVGSHGFHYRMQISTFQEAPQRLEALTAMASLQSSDLLQALIAACR